MDFNIINLDDVFTAKDCPAPSESWILIHNDKNYLNNIFVKPNLLSIAGSAVVVTDDKDVIGTADELMKKGKDVNILFLDMVMAGKGYRPLIHNMSNDEDIDNFIDILLSETGLDDYSRTRASFLLNAIIRMMKDTIEEDDITFSTLSNLLKYSMTNYKRNGASALSELFESENVASNDKSDFTSYFNSYMLTSEHHSDAEIYIALQKALLPLLRMEDNDNKGIKEQIKLDNVSDKASVLFVVYNREKKHSIAEKLVFSDIIKNLNRKELFNVPVTIFVDDDEFDPLIFKNLKQLMTRGVNLEWITSNRYINNVWQYDNIFPHIADVNKIYKSMDVKKSLSFELNAPHSDAASKKDTNNVEAMVSTSNESAKKEPVQAERTVPFSLKVADKVTNTIPVEKEQTGTRPAQTRAMNRENGVKPVAGFRLKFDQNNTAKSNTTIQESGENQIDKKKTTVNTSISEPNQVSVSKKPIVTPETKNSSVVVEDTKSAEEIAASEWLFADEDN